MHEHTAGNVNGQLFMYAHANMFISLLTTFFKKDKALLLKAFKGLQD